MIAITRAVSVGVAEQCGATQDEMVGEHWRVKITHQVMSIQLLTHVRRETYFLFFFAPFLSFVIVQD